MRHHLSRPAVFGASLALAAGICSAASAATSGHQAARAALASVSTTPASGVTTRSVFLINGARVGVPSAQAPEQTVATDSPGDRLQALTMGGQRYLLPDDAVPYLGRGLDPSLFQVGPLAAAEAAGRLPIRISYAGSPPSLPGVTITSPGHGTATGYLTAAGAARLGAALARQYTADHARGSYGQDGLFGHGVSVTLAGAPAPTTATTAKPQATHTLTVDGTNLSGQPDTGDYVVVTNVDNGSLFSNPKQSIAVFHNGVATFQVPAGNYWAIGEFNVGFYTVSRVVVLPQFSVTANTTEHVAEQAATSQIQMVTAKPTIMRDIGFLLARTAKTGPVEGMQWLNEDGFVHPSPPMWVSPTQTAPTVGALTSVTEGWLFPPSGTPGHYEYDLAYPAYGTIPTQHYVINQASLATETARFYQDTTSHGLEGRTPVFPIEARTYNVQDDAIESITPFYLHNLPATRTIYMSTPPGLAWQEAVYPSAYWAGYGGQGSSPRSYVPGQRVNSSWGEFPLHPAPNVKLIQNQAEAGPLIVSANRSGDILTLYQTAFSDSVPGHTGGPVIFQPFIGIASYEIDQNGTKIAGGVVPSFRGIFGVRVPLAQQPSTIRFTLNTKVRSYLQRLSTASHTVWTWRSAPETGRSVPAGWACTFTTRTPTHDCAAEPMMTLGYNVLGEALDGSTSPGQQVIRVSVGHIQLAAQPKVTGLTMQASFDGGKTWHPAQITGAGNGYAAVFNALAGAKVTLRTSATDAAGGSISETITDAYQIAS